MMRMSLAVIAVLIPAIGLAQKKCERIKLHAYQRSTLPGMVPGGVVNEDGKMVEARPRINTTYYLYLETPVKKKLDISTIWINGEAYNADVDTVQSKPVVIGKTPVGNLQRTDTLVRNTPHTLLQLKPKQKKEITPTEKIRSILERHDVMVEFAIGRRKYYSSQEEIKKLEPLALQ